MPQLHFDDGYMVDGRPLQIASFLVGTDTSAGALCATTVQDSKQMDMPCVVAGSAKWGVIWVTNASVYSETN